VAYKKSAKKNVLGVSQCKQEYAEAKIRFNLKFDQLVFYTGVGEEGVRRILNHYEIYI